MRSLRSAMKSTPYLRQLEKVHVQHEDPAQPTTTTKFFKRKDIKMMPVKCPSTVSGISEVLRNIFRKKSDLERSTGLSSHPDSRARPASESLTPPAPPAACPVSSCFYTQTPFLLLQNLPNPYPSVSVT